MQHAKYIMIDHDLAGEVAIIFHPILQHVNVADGLPYNVVSAGFVQVTDTGTVEAYGESISLNISSREKDRQIIQHMLQYGTKLI